jgi:hypothetical protein
MSKRLFALPILLLIAAFAVACGGATVAPPTEAQLALRDHVDYPSYAIGLVVPNAAEIERVTGRAVAAIRAVEYEPNRSASFDALDSSGKVIATFTVEYGEALAEPLVPGGRLSVTADAGTSTDALISIATEHATRLHDTGYEVPALPENLEPGLYLVEGLAHDLQGWLDALQDGDTSPASSGETVVLFGCNAGRTFETARWLFTSAPCLDAARAAWLIHDGDLEAAGGMLQSALARLEEITAAFNAAIAG